MSKHLIALPAAAWRPVPLACSRAERASLNEMPVPSPSRPRALRGKPGRILPSKRRPPSRARFERNRSPARS